MEDAGFWSGFEDAREDWRGLEERLEVKAWRWVDPVVNFPTLCTWFEGREVAIFDVGAGAEPRRGLEGAIALVLVGSV